MPLQKTHAEFVAEVKHRAGAEYSVLGRYENNATKLLMRHSVCGSEYSVSPNKFLSGRRCPACSRKKSGPRGPRQSTQEFRLKVSALTGGEYSVLGEYHGSNQHICMKHNVCGHAWQVLPSNFMHCQSRCPICAKGDRYRRTVCGQGYIGEGEFASCTSDGHRNDYYRVWESMIRRCYSRKVHVKQPTYEGCSVCDEWLNLQRFARWYTENHYAVSGETMNLDKDILVEGNRIYSPETCIFVPRRINLAFRRRSDFGGQRMVNTLRKYEGRLPARVLDAIVERISVLV